LENGTCRLDPAAKPAEIDAKFGEHDYSKWKGIYKLDKDTLTICVADPGADRPKEFTAGKEVKAMLLTFKRDKPREEDKRTTGRLLMGSKFRQMPFPMPHSHAAHAPFPADAIYSKDGKALLSWRVAILPHLGYGDLYKQFKLDEPWDSEHNKKLIAKMPEVYAAPPGAKVAAAEPLYQVFAGNGAIFEGRQGIKFTEAFDGTSNTLLIVEASESVPWTKPADLPYDPQKPLPQLGGTYPDGKFNVILADGSPRILKL